MDDFWIRPDQLDEGGSKLRVSPGELDCQSREYQVKVAPVSEVSGAKEGGTESPVCECPFGGRLCDGSLSRPSKPIQPVDGGFVKVAGPEFDRVQNCGARSLEATIAVAMLILGLLCTPDTAEDGSFDCGSFFQAIVIGNVKARRCSNLGPVERSLRVPKHKWRDSLSVRTPDCGLPSVAPSTVLINVETSIRPEVVNGPDSRGSPLGDRQEAGTSRHRLEHDQ